MLIYIEKEFNDLLLKNGYASLFNFIKLKEFIEQLISDIINLIRSNHFFRITIFSYSFSVINPDLIASSFKVVPFL